jgi:hypothetical protein
MELLRQCGNLRRGGVEGQALSNEGRIIFENESRKGVLVRSREAP